MIRAVTFDVAGTLIAPREPIGQTYAREAGRFGIEADPAAVDARFRAAFHAAPPLAFAGAADGEVPRLERAWWRDVVRGAFGPGATHARFDECFDALYARYARAEAWTIFPDVPEGLRALRDRGARLGVLSNFDGRLPALLDELGIGTLVDAVLWSSAIGAAKPSCAAFETAAHRLGVPIETLCHVGDDLVADVEGARAAGAHAMHLDRSGRRPDSPTTLTELRMPLNPGR